MYLNTRLYKMLKYISKFRINFFFDWERIKQGGESGGNQKT